MAGTGVLLLLIGCWPLTAALSCAPCEETVCRALRCSGGTVRDACGCCDTCARAEGQECGGYFDSLGRCDEGFTCQTRPRLGQMVDQLTPGVCTRSEPSCQICQLMLGQCVCSTLADCRVPDVSRDPTVFTSRAECQAAVPSRRVGLPVTARPPVAVAPCPGVTCETPVTFCPVDSVLKIGPSEHPDCCPPTAECVCDLESCPLTQKCPEGQKATLVGRPRRPPGACCSQWQCQVVDEEPTCTHGGRTYRAGDMWKANKCTTCHCKNAPLTFCSSVECRPPPNCSQFTHHPEECCPRCIDGCRSPSGVYHNNSERWLEDDCTTCSCTNGTRHCHTQMCHVTCHRPRTVPGRCCPVCDESECDRACRHGYRTDADGKALCQCLSAHEVAAKPPKCRAMADCRRHCPHGFKLDENGCQRCKCKRCRRLKNCSLKCPLAENERGCTICRCNAEQPRPTPVNHLSCLLSDGTVNADGDFWHDGCRQCFCHKGSEMCDIISCPVPACERPEIFAGHCCPTCPDVAAPSPRHVNASVCQSVDGTTYADGQTWRLDTCTRCVCLAGRVLCASPQCLPAPCEQPDRPADACCAVCPPDVSGVSGAGRPCADGAARRRRHGQTWRTSACRSCLCHDGHTRCFHQSCPELDCRQPVLKKDQCCPECLGQTKSYDCTYHNRTLRANQSVFVDECTSCACTDGQVMCNRKICSVSCQKPTPVPGQCCPVCRDESNSRHNYHFLNGTSKATHRTRMPAPEQPTQTSQPGIHRETGSSQPSILHIMLYSTLALLPVVMAASCWCVCWHRRRSRFTPKQDPTDEKKPLNGAPQTIDCAHLNGPGRVGVLPSTSMHDKTGLSVIRHT